MIQFLAVLSFLAAPQEGKPDEGRLRGLIDQLGADFLEDREAARKALEEAGKAAEAVLIAALNRPDYRVRQACVDLLAAFKSEAAIRRVGEVFRTDEDPAVRDSAFAFLRKTGPPAEEFLVFALESPRAEHRLEAVKALAEFRSEKCARQMYDLHENDPDKATRDQAFEYLRTIGKPAEPYLIKLLAHADPAIRKGALDGLRKAQGSAPEPEAKALEAVARLYGAETDAITLKEAFDYLRAAGLRAEPCFIEGLRSKQDAVRGFSVEGLRELKSERAADAVAAAFLGDESAEVRRQACEFLKGLGLKAEDAFIKGLSSPNSKVKLMAVPALGEIRSGKPLERISLMFREDPDPEVHRAAFEYLKGLGAPAEKDLVRALGDPDKGIRLEAIRALGLAKSASAVEPLIDFMAQLDPETRRAAEDALVHIGRPAVEAAYKAAEAGRIKKRAADGVFALFGQEEVERALDALITPEGGSGFFPGMFKPLEAVGKEKAVPLLLKMVTEPGYAWRLPASGDRPNDWSRKMQELAVLALGELGDAAAVAPLLGVLKETSADPDDDIREELVVALHRLGEKKPFEEFSEAASVRAEVSLKAGDLDVGCGALFQLGLVRNRVGLAKEAEAAYARILAAVEERKAAPGEVDCVPVVRYNLACMAAARGDKAAAVKRLRESVEAGFRDREWILKDRDLDPIRGEDAYLRLMADEALFKKKVGE